MTQKNNGCVVDVQRRQDYFLMIYVGLLGTDAAQTLLIKTTLTDNGTLVLSFGSSRYSQEYASMIFFEQSTLAYYRQSHEFMYQAAANSINNSRQVR